MLRGTAQGYREVEPRLEIHPYDTLRCLIKSPKYRRVDICFVIAIYVYVVKKFNVYVNVLCARELSLSLSLSGYI